MSILWIYSMTWKNVAKIVVTFEPIIQFWCPSRFRILIPTLFYEREKKRKTLTIWPLGWVGLGVTVTFVHMTVLKAAYWVIASPVSQLQLCNFTTFVTEIQTHQRTWRLYDQPLRSLIPLYPSQWCPASICSNVLLYLFPLLADISLNGPWHVCKSPIRQSRLST